MSKQLLKEMKSKSKTALQLVKKKPIYKVQPDGKPEKDSTHVELKGKVYEKDVELCETCDNTSQDTKKPIKKRK